MAHFIDRRLNGKKKSTVNRQKFIRRYKQQIKEAVSDAISKRSVTDIDSGESVSIPHKDIGEPMFHQGKGGKRNTVHPGNDQFSTGDKIKRPQSGQGGGAGWCGWPDALRGPNRRRGRRDGGARGGPRQRETYSPWRGDQG